MKALAVLYHDVVEDEFDESGFPGAAAARYKIYRKDFSIHLDEIRTRLAVPVVATSIDALSATPTPLLFTVDDGGSSAMHVAAALENFGWRGTFFITTDQIGKRAFLTADEIRMLHVQGHTIGSHSCSHPYRMADLPQELLEDEWERSSITLSNIVGQNIVVGSVPGGFYSPRVASAARKAGIRILFNSEPTRSVHEIDECFVVGRYNIYNKMSAVVAGKLASANPYALFKQQASWTAKKAVKSLAAPIWDRSRARFFKS